MTVRFYLTYSLKASLMKRKHSAHLLCLNLADEFTHRNYSIAQNCGLHVPAKPNLSIKFRDDLINTWIFPFQKDRVELSPFKFHVRKCPDLFLPLQKERQFLPQCDKYSVLSLHTLVNFNYQTDTISAEQASLQSF